jgi:hypothetical protein
MVEGDIKYRRWCGYLACRLEEAAAEAYLEVTS